MSGARPGGNPSGHVSGHTYGRTCGHARGRAPGRSVPAAPENPEVDERKRSCDGADCGAAVGAAFGPARVRLATGDRHGAVRVLESVPGSSIHHTAARAAALRARPRDTDLDVLRRERSTTEVLGCALDWVLAGERGVPAPACPAPERSLRLLARLARAGAERIEPVERANRLRPRTWV